MRGHIELCAVRLPLRAMSTLKSPLLQGLWLRALGHAPMGGAEPGECFRVQKSVADKSESFAAWYDAWKATADRLRERGQAHAEASRAVSAKECFMRASNYYRTAYSPYFGSKEDRVKVLEGYKAHRETFKRALEHIPSTSRVGVKEIEVPFGHVDPKLAVIRGYLFFPLDDSLARPMPTVIVNGGYDSTAEECYLFSAASAVANGFAAITFDGPGQGGAIIENNVPFRPDWEVVLTAVVDYLVASETEIVDPDRIGVIGISFGGYLAPRGVSREPRIKALVADPGELSLYGEFAARVPGWFIKALDEPEAHPFLVSIVSFLLDSMSRNPSKGWTLRRGMLVHNVGSPFEYLQITKAYTVEPFVHQISCPTMICSAENDQIGVTADALFDKLTGCTVKERVRFTAEEGAGDHCESASRSVFNQSALAFLQKHLATPSHEETH